MDWLSERDGYGWNSDNGVLISSLFDSEDYDDEIDYVNRNLAQEYNAWCPFWYHPERVVWKLVKP